MDRSLVIYHAYLILTHGGSLCEGCAICEELSTLAEATEMTLTGLSDEEVEHP